MLINIIAGIMYLLLVSALIYIAFKLGGKNTRISELEQTIRNLIAERAVDTESMNAQILLLRDQYDSYVKDSTNRYNKLLGQKKSSEVKLGQISEHMAPFMKDWPYDSKNFRFLGSPIDGVSFNDDEIVLMEIKSGSSKMSKKQRDIKDMVEGAKIKFVTFRVGEEGSKVEKEYVPEPVREECCDGI